LLFAALKGRGFNRATTPIHKFLEINQRDEGASLSLRLTLENTNFNPAANS
jgi:hypothetical protein